MKELGITESDLEEKFIKCSGHGGQKVNKTSTDVYLKPNFIIKKLNILVTQVVIIFIVV